MTTIEAYQEIDKQNEKHLLKEYSPLVKRIAHHLFNRLPAKIQLEDLIQTGMIGLHEAIKTYDPTKGASLSTYANLKIRGFILDDLRSNEWLPRSVQENSRNISTAIRKIENLTGKSASAIQIAEELGVSIESYHEMLKDLNGSRILDITDPLTETEVHDDTTPQASIQDEQLQKNLTKLINILPEREKILLSLYYFEELNFKEIGKVLNVTESRICQLHSQALMLNCCQVMTSVIAINTCCSCAMMVLILLKSMVKSYS